jgi:hypothetical protein
MEKNKITIKELDERLERLEMLERLRTLPLKERCHFYVNYLLKSYEPRKLSSGYPH